MRYIFLFLVTIFLASCGNHKMRFSRSISTQQKVVEISEVHTLKKAVSSSDDSQVLSSDEVTPNASSTEEANTYVSEQDLPQSDALYTEIPSIYDNPEDSTVVSREEAEEIKEEALWAANQGKLSLTFSILTPLFFLAGAIIFIFALLGGVGPASAILGILLLGLSVASIILSMIFGIRSLNAQYNTEKGRKKAIGGIVISSFFIALFLFNIVLGLL